MRVAARWVSPLAVPVMNARFDAHHAGQIVVVDNGDASVAARLANALDARVGVAHPTDLLVSVAAPGAPNADLATVVGDHRRAGGDVLIVVVGNAVQRRAIERELRADRDVGISVMLFVDDLQGADLDRTRRRVADQVITSDRADHVISGGGGYRRRYASSLPDVAERMEQRMAQQLAIRAALVDDPAKTAASMKSGHATLVAGTMGASNNGVDPKRAGVVASVALLAAVWRRSAGRLEAFVPFTRIVVRGGLVYSLTRLVGVTAQRVAAYHRDPPQEDR
jgi:hypothetical protein